MDLNSNPANPSPPACFPCIHHHHPGYHHHALHHLTSNILTLDVAQLIQPAPDSECIAYELYIHLPELSKLWSSLSWPHWPNQTTLAPALHALELSFRMISCVLCDYRPHINRSEWLTRLEALVKAQLDVIALISEGDLEAPVAKLSVSTGVLAMTDGQEVWQRLGAQPVVSKSSQESLLPRLACWNKAHDVVAGIHLAIECSMFRCPFTLGLGEPNLAGKPILEYDQICKPAQLYEHKQPIKDCSEDHMLSTVLQICECWLYVIQGLIKKVQTSIQKGGFEEASKKSWLVERVCKLVSNAMDLLCLIDPDDLMKLKHELAIGMNKDLQSNNVGYYLRSNLLRFATKACKELSHLVPKVVGVEADPKGGPRLQEAVMDLLHNHSLPPLTTNPAETHTNNLNLASNQASAVHVLQAFQAIEVSVREFYFSYQQLIVSMMGSGGFKSSCEGGVISACAALSLIYLEPPYFPSVDGAKTFLGNYWDYHHSEEEGCTIKELLVQRANKGSIMCCSGSKDFSTTVSVMPSEDNMAGAGDVI